MTFLPRKLALITGAIALTGLSVPALAGWKLVSADKPAIVGAFKLTPKSDWNLGGFRPGKQVTTLTHDGFDLDALELFSGISAGEPTYRDRKSNPIPRFDKTMLLTDLGDLFERSFRASHNLTDFTTETVIPADFLGQKGVAIRYHYSEPGDALVRQGIARMVVVAGKLYAANFFAPRLHYFPARLAEIESMMSDARLK